MEEVEFCLLMSLTDTYLFFYNNYDHLFLRSYYNTLCSIFEDNNFDPILPNFI